MKFGGTSTQDAAAMRNVVGIVTANLNRKPLVVISAIAQATNMLEQTGKLAGQGKAGEARDVLLKLFDRHYTIIDALIHDRQRNAELRKIITQSFRELEELVKGLAIVRELTPRMLDTFYCYGELLSSRIIAAALQENGIAAEWLDTKDFLQTDENFNRASPVWNIVEERLSAIALPLISQGIVPVTQGFIGATASGQRTTMGRESSDYSASIIGTVLNVEDIQIWTDVDGVLTADPRIVAAPKKIKTLSFEEAYELSYFGAKVLHPKTILPAVEKNIPVHIYNSQRPHLSGTKVAANSHPSGSAIKSVAYKRNVVVVNVMPKKRLSQYMLWEHINNILTQHDAVTNMTVTSEYSYAFVLESSGRIGSIVDNLREIGVVTLLPEKGIVCLVGSNIRQSPHIVNRVFHVVAEFGITMISFGASSSNISFVVDDAVVPDAVRKIHAEFFENTIDLQTFETLEHFTAQPQSA